MNNGAKELNDLWQSMQHFKSLGKFRRSDPDFDIEKPPEPLPEELTWFQWNYVCLEREKQFVGEADRGTGQSSAWNLAEMESAGQEEN